MKIYNFTSVNGSCGMNNFALLVFAVSRFYWIILKTETYNFVLLFNADLYG